MNIKFLAIIVFLCSLPAISWPAGDFLARPLSTHEKVAHLLSLSIPDEQRISICFNYGCQQRQTIQFTNEDKEHIKIIFAQSEAGRISERQAIADAIAYMESISGKQSPVHNDRAKNFNDKGSGRMDCIDSAVNTTNYLRFISRLGLLKKHKLIQPVYRSPFMMGQHWSARIMELSSGRIFAVDSWASDNGQRPLIQKVSNWKTRDSEGIESYSNQSHRNKSYLNKL